MTPTARALLDIVIAETSLSAVIDHLVDAHGIHVLSRKTAGVRWELRRTEEDR